MDKINKVQKTIEKIKKLKIQGATAIAKASLKALKDVDIDNLREVVKNLSQARPTEPLTRNCLAYVAWQVEKGKDLKEVVDLMLARLDDVEHEIVQNGVQLIKSGMKIFTHCHSSMVEKVLKAAHQKGIKFEVYLTETRPLFQGRITARNLTKAGIKTTMIADSAAAYTISHLDKVKIDLILLGSDAIAADGSCVNKIGSFSIALAAWQAKIPLYVVASLLKFDPLAIKGKEIKIEERQPAEIWRNPPQKLRIINPAFDLLTQDKISGYISEFGMIKPNQVLKIVKKNYPWILEQQKTGKRRKRTSKKFSYLHLNERPNWQKNIIVTFRLTSPHSLNQAAEQIAAESSIGTWTKITNETQKIFNQLSARVFEVDRNQGIIKIAYPLSLFEPGNIPQLLSSVAGNIFGMKTITSLRLEDLELPEKYVRCFPGPSFGLKGVKKFFGIKKGPLLASIIKPKEGLPVEDHVKVAQSLFQAGINLVKDDENLTSPYFNPFDKRLVLMMKVIHQSKEPKLYAFNISAPYQLMINRALKAKNAGSHCVMVDFLTVGFSALQSLRKKFPGLIIHGHRAMHGAITRNKKQGISMLVLAKLARLAGIDQLHTGTIIGKMEGEKAEILKINNFLRSEWYGLKSVLPIASGGLYPTLIPKLISILGEEMVFAFGGGIHGHPQGPFAGARAVIEAVEAVKKKISLKKYAQDHQSLKIALKTWSEVRW